MKNALNVNPQILKWAREESGYTIDKIAEKLGINIDSYLQWEATGEGVPFSKLKLIAASYKRQIATFFLAELPPKIKKPEDYRNLSLVGTPLSKETLLAFRRIIRYQELLVEIYGQKYFEDKYCWLREYQTSFSRAVNSDQIAYWLRDKLEFPFEEQLTEKNNETCYKRWRDSFANRLGILNFQFSLPTDEIQGFSYSDSTPFCIAINGKDYSTNSRIFTLFHEFAHLIQHQSGICMPNSVVKDQYIEYDVNKFASALLIPEDKVILSTDPDEIYQISRKFKVSSEVYLRRMRDLDRISEKRFFDLLEILRQRVKPSKKGGRSTPLQKCISAKGQFFYGSITTAAKNGILSYSQASEVLGLKVNHFISE
jgi:Zn-dependent peptidase ImmA (M78 family)/DNA-binding XRE family transcriptional regulator